MVPQLVTPQAPSPGEIKVATLHLVNLVSTVSSLRILNPIQVRFPHPTRMVKHLRDTHLCESASSIRYSTIVKYFSYYSYRTCVLTRSTSTHKPNPIIADGTPLKPATRKEGCVHQFLFFFVYITCVNHIHNTRIHGHSTGNIYTRFRQPASLHRGLILIRIYSVEFLGLEPVPGYL